MHCVIFSWSLFMDACKHLYYRDMEFWWSITVCILRLFFSYHNFFPVRYGHYFIWDQCLWTLCLKKLRLKSCCWDMKWGHLRFYYMHDRNQPMHACTHILLNSLHVYWIGILIFFPFIAFQPILLFLLCQIFWHILILVHTMIEVAVCTRHIFAPIFTYSKFWILWLIFVSIFSFWSIFHQSCKGKYIYSVCSLFIQSCKNGDYHFPCKVS